MDAIIWVVCVDLRTDTQKACVQKKLDCVFKYLLAILG